MTDFLTGWANQQMSNQVHVFADDAWILFRLIVAASHVNAQTRLSTLGSMMRPALPMALAR